MLKIGRRISLRCFLAFVGIISMGLGYLSFRETQMRRVCGELQNLDVSLDLDFDPGYFPSSFAALFPAAFNSPDRAWIHYQVRGSKISVGGNEYKLAEVKPHFEQIIEKAENAGFEIRFLSLIHI